MVDVYIYLTYNYNYHHTMQRLYNENCVMAAKCVFVLGHLTDISSFWCSREAQPGKIWAMASCVTNLGAYGKKSKFYPPQSSLVGGFNPTETYLPLWESSPNRGENKSIWVAIELPPSRFKTCFTQKWHPRKTGRFLLWKLETHHFCRLDSR